MTRVRCIALVSVAVLFPGQTLWAQGNELQNLLSSLVRPANTIAYFHPPALKNLLSDADANHSLPDAITESWLAAELDVTSLEPRWEIGYANMAHVPSAEALAKLVGGYTDSVENTPVVWSPRQSYLVPRSDTQIGFVRPANRQLLGDWLRNTSGNHVSSYLLSQTRQPEQFLSLLIAIDLENLISPVPLEKRLEKLQAVQGIDSRAVLNLFGSVRGISVIIGRRSLSECIVSIEFGSSPKILEPVAAQAFGEILQQNGMAIPESSAWKTKVDGNTLSFQGPIEESTLDSLIGIFSVQQHAHELHRDASRNESSASGSPQPSAAAIASKEYFDQVNKLIERVRRFSAQTTGARAKWNDQIARRVDDLGTLNVDAQLVEYATNVASVLRANSLTIRQGNIQAGAAKAEQSLYRGGYSGDGYNLYFDPNTPTDYQRVISAQASAGAYSDYRKALSDIDQMTADIRRAMTDKFQVQF